MPESAPDDITDFGERALWRDLSRQFEYYCGNDKARWAERQKSFVKITLRIAAEIDSKAVEMRGALNQALPPA